MTIKELEEEIKWLEEEIEAIGPDQDLIEALERLEAEYQFKCDERDRYADLHG